MAGMHGYVLLGRTDTVVNGTKMNAAAATANTVLTLYQTNLNGPAADHGARYKMLIFVAIATHGSAASGYTVDTSMDGGVTWDNIQATTIADATVSRVYTKIEAPEIRVRWTQGAADAAAFRWSLMGDRYERGNG